MTRLARGMIAASASLAVVVWFVKLGLDQEAARQEQIVDDKAAIVRAAKERQETETRVGQRLAPFRQFVDRNTHPGKDGGRFLNNGISCDAVASAFGQPDSKVDRGEFENWVYRISTNDAPRFECSKSRNELTEVSVDDYTISQFMYQFRSSR